MRIKLVGRVVDKTNQSKTNYKHEVYGMILNKLSPELAKRIHSKEKFYRLLSFSDVYITKYSKDNIKMHMYIVGEDNIIQDFINHLIFDNWIRIDDMVIEVKVEALQPLQPKEYYNFKTNLIVNISQNNKCVLSDDIGYIESRLKEIALNKAKQLNIRKDNLDIKVLKYTKKYNKYKNHHIESWKCKLQVKGDYELVNMIYSTTGIGENTASGHGLVWEVN